MSGNRKTGPIARYPSTRKRLAYQVQCCDGIRKSHPFFSREQAEVLRKLWDKDCYIPNSTHTIVEVWQ